MQQKSQQNARVDAKHDLLKKVCFNAMLCTTAFMLFSHTNAFAISGDAVLLQAKEAYVARNETVLVQYANELQAQDNLLAPYAQYWLMLLRLETTDDVELLTFLNTYEAFPFANKVRGEWLKKIAKQQNWPLFFEHYARYQVNDVAVQCEALLGHEALGDLDIASDTKALWLTSADLPSNCDQLFDAMQQKGTLSVDDIYQRLRIALQEGKLDLAKNIVMRLENVDAISVKLIDRAYQTPQLLLEKKLISFKSRFGAEVNLFALDRLARTKLTTAIDIYKGLQFEFDPQNRAFGWGRLALYAARGHDPNALSFYGLAQKPASLPANLQLLPLYKEQLAWKARAALRDQNWEAVLGAIKEMSPKQAEEGVWRYWKARALKERALNTQEPAQSEPAQKASAIEAAQLANQLFIPLAKERHYYGWLAAEELDAVLGNMPDAPYVPLEAQMQAIANQPAIKRALALQRLDMRWEAKTEWLAAMRNFDDQQLIAAANYATQLKWYEIAIITADSTKQLHDFNVRYPTPYRDLIRSAANSEQIDEAWVYGLTRQESRFMDYAKSGVGASGLMQLMPATAKWAAKRMGIYTYTNAMIHDLRTNIQIGAYYMRHTLDLMGGQAVMATAAYNAGPSRAKRWMASEPLEGAIYIETIPFSETRNYVQKVMANAHLYAPRLGTKIQSLKARIGIVPGSGAMIDGTLSESKLSENASRENTVNNN